LFTITQPSERGLRELLDKWKDAPFSYRDVGATRDGPVPTGYNIDRYRVKLGSGSEIFDAAKRAVQAWAMFDLEWVSIFPSTAVIQPGAVVAVVVAHFGFWSANLARVVYVDPQDAMFRFAYGTLGEHAESGEERFTVSTDQNGRLV